MEATLKHLKRVFPTKNYNYRYNSNYKNYSVLFKRNYEVFGYNLYLEENLSKDSSKNQLKRGKKKLFKKYGETSKQYLREHLFENSCVIKSEKCKYLDTDDFVTILN